MNSEQYLEIAMSLGSEITDDDKLIMLLAVARKTNPEDWSCSFVNATLQKLGYQSTELDLPESYLKYGKVSKGKLGEIVVYEDGNNHSKVGFYHKRITHVLEPFLELEAEDAGIEPTALEDELASVTELTFIQVITTLDDGNKTITDSIPLNKILSIRSLVKLNIPEPVVNKASNLAKKLKANKKH